MTNELATRAETLELGPTANKLGAFLIQTQLQSSGHSSAMCMTAAAQNLLSLKLAASLGIVIASPWLTWFKAACVPGIVGLVLTPYLVGVVRVAHGFRV